MHTIRIGTFNVRAVWGPGQQAIAQLLRQSRVDVVCLQECWASTVEPIRQAMGPQWHTSIQPRDDTSNVILSRAPLTHVRTLPIEVDGPYEIRSAVIAWVDWPDYGPISVCSTHLEQRDEAARLRQWQMIREHLGDEAIVGGDLNALRRGDYSTDQWADMTRLRAANRWAPPESRLTDELNEDGFRDAWVDAGQGPLEPTCAYGTRIDYILLGPHFDGRFEPGSYSRAPTMANHLSDHELVFVDVNLGPSPRRDHESP